MPTVAVGIHCNVLVDENCNPMNSNKKVLDITQRLQEKCRKQHIEANRDKVETTQRIVQCGLCQIKCAMCGYHARSADSPRQLILSPFGFSLCEICSAEFEDFLKIKQGKLEADVFWHNTEWLKLWSAWLDFQRTIMDFRNSSEFKQLQGN